MLIFDVMWMCLFLVLLSGSICTIPFVYAMLAGIAWYSFEYFINPIAGRIYNLGSSCIEVLANLWTGASNYLQESDTQGASSGPTPPTPAPTPIVSVDADGKVNFDLAQHLWDEWIMYFLRGCDDAPQPQVSDLRQQSENTAKRGMFTFGVRCVLLLFFAYVMLKLLNWLLREVKKTISELMLREGFELFVARFACLTSAFSWLLAHRCPAPLRTVSATVWKFVTGWLVLQPFHSMSRLFTDLWVEQPIESADPPIASRNDYLNKMAAYICRLYNNFRSIGLDSVNYVNEFSESRRHEFAQAIEQGVQQTDDNLKQELQRYRRKQPTETLQNTAFESLFHKSTFLTSDAWSLFSSRLPAWHGIVTHLNIQHDTPLAAADAQYKRADANHETGKRTANTYSSVVRGAWVCFVCVALIMFWPRARLAEYCSDFDVGFNETIMVPNQHETLEWIKDPAITQLKLTNEAVAAHIHEPKTGNMMCVTGSYEKHLSETDPHDFLVNKTTLDNDFFDMTSKVHNFTSVKRDFHTKCHDETTNERESPAAWVWFAITHGLPQNWPTVEDECNKKFNETPFATPDWNETELTAKLENINITCFETDPFSSRTEVSYREANPQQYWNFLLSQSHTFIVIVLVFVAIPVFILFTRDMFIRFALWLLLPRK